MDPGAGHGPARLLSAHPNADGGAPPGEATYVTHYNTWREMDYAVRYGGLTPARAFHAASQANARILGLDKVTRSAEPGKAADLVILRANPLDDFRVFASPTMVIARGTIIEHPAVERFDQIDAQCAMNAERSQPCRLRGSLMRCCMRDEGFVAPRSRPAEGGFKPPHAALAEDRRGER